MSDETNPKDLLGSRKISTFVIPTSATLHLAHAMMEGAKRYSSFNWRSKKVKASIYLDALERHVISWKEGEERAQDSGVHHLGHAMACLAIILDALETGNLVDDRPPKGEGCIKLLNTLNSIIAEKK